MWCIRSTVRNCVVPPVRFAELWASAFLPGEHQGTYVNQTQLDPADLAPRQVAHRLHPELVEVDLVLAPVPPPRLVEAEEHTPPRPAELLQHQRLLARLLARRWRRWMHPIEA